jgi:hypothetical protein
VAAFVAGSVLAIAPALGNTYSDQGAAVLVWPKIVVRTSAPATDTLIQINNLDRNNTTAAHCFYVNANSHCANTGAVCESASDCEQNGIFAPCVEGWIEVNFDVILTPNQPLAWSASDGLSGSDIPCPGTLGSSCSGNQGTRVPPVTESPFIGELKCIQSDPITRFPIQCSGSACQNDLAGTATIFRASQANGADGLGYNAVGLRTFGDNDGDRVLNIGGPNAEYEPCHDVLILNHFFDGAMDPVGNLPVETELTLVPCTQDFLTQTTDAVTAQFLVYNEFEQRFSTSRQVRCLLDIVISNIDTSQSERSIFSVGTSGTIAGQTRIHGVGGGLIGAAVVTQESLMSSGGAAYNLNGFAEREDGDQIRVP